MTKPYLSDFQPGSLATTGYSEVDAILRTDPAPFFSSHTNPVSNDQSEILSDPEEHSVLINLRGTKKEN